MKLRGRFTLWFGLAALVPIATAALVTRAIVSRALLEDAQRSQAVSTKEMRRVLGVARADVETRARSLASRETSYAGGTLLELGTHEGQLPEESRMRLREDGAPLMRQLALQVMFLLDQDSRVLNAPHNVGAMGETLEGLTEAARSGPGEAFFSMETILASHGLERVLVLEAASLLRDQGSRYSVVVVGGRRMSTEAFDSVRKFDGVQVRVVSHSGETLVPSNSAWNQQAAKAVFPLRGRGGEEIARVEMTIANVALPALLGRVTLYSVLLAGGALLLSLLLGFLVAKRITRDLDRLVAGAQAVARGELDHLVKTRNEDEIGEVGDALNTMMTDLKDSKERLVMAQRVAAWQEIARRLAHEIKNPLTPIQMSMETLRKTYQKKHPAFAEIFEESTATVLEEAARLKRIVSEFSEFARMPKPQKAALDLVEMVHSQLALYAGNTKIEKHLDPGVPKIDADRDALSQLLLNLIANARDAIGEEEDGVVGVSVRLSASGQSVMILIDDNGPGVSLQCRESLFTPYYTTKHAKGGTGLGLAIAHRIVLDHRGRITVGDSPLGGARFSVELPLGDETEERRSG